MRVKLNKFRQFSEKLLPLETTLLNDVQQFEDEDRKLILERVHRAAHGKDKLLELEDHIDKRKYSDMLKWMQKRLDELDVDFEYDKLSEIDLRIHRDNVELEDERTIIKLLERIRPESYNFMAFYEMLLKYRQFLLIRMHFEPFERVNDYLDQFEQSYGDARTINDKLHLATRDIVSQYITGNTTVEAWDDFLLGVFSNTALDGHNRYAALVRYTFSIFNRRAYELLIAPYNQQEELFKSGTMYSRRLLLNYYSNRSILHAHLGQHTMAIEYGYLSVKSPNNDYIHYVNNLAALLLRQNKPEESLLLIRKAFPYVKNISGFQHRLGLVTFYILSLNRTQQQNESDRFAWNFFKGYKKEIFNHRWYLFMSAWLQALLHMKQYDKISLLVQRNDLLKLEKKFSARSAYMPYIPVYAVIASYRTGSMRRETAREKLEQYLSDIRFSEHKKRYIRDLLNEIQVHASELGTLNPDIEGIHF